MRIGIGISEDLPLGAQRDLARAVEEAPFASLWTNEARGRDALLTCQAWGEATDELLLGVGVLPIWTRTPAQIAMAAATLQEATDGRLLLGLGVSHPGTMATWHGVDYRRPLTAARETLAVLRQAFAGHRTDADGDIMSSQGFELGITPLPTPPTMLLAAMGPRMLELAGADADGVMLNWAGPEEVARAGGRARAGAEDDLEVTTYVRVAVDDDRERARSALAREIGRYCALPAYADHLDRQGFGAAVDAVKAAYREGGEAAVPDALDDDVLLSLGWYGTSDDDPSPTLLRYADAGLDHLVARVVVTDDDPAASVRRAITTLPSAVTDGDAGAAAP